MNNIKKDNENPFLKKIEEISGNKENSIINQEKLEQLKQKLGKISDNDIVQKLVTGKDKLPIDQIFNNKESTTKNNTEQKDVVVKKVKTVKEPENNNEKPEINPKPVSPTDKLKDYLETLKKEGISEDEAIAILIGIYYDGKYELECKIVGHNVVFQVCPPEFEQSKFLILNEQSPIYKQHENALLGDLALAGAIKSFDGHEFNNGETPDDQFRNRYKFIKGLNSYIKMSLMNKYFEFEKKIYTVTQHPGADDFFESIRDRSMKSG